LHLLGTVPSPARTFPDLKPAVNQAPHIPCSPPRHAPTVSCVPTAPPPPPMPPVMDCEAVPSYRERLRAGGQGAFQRAFNNGLMPKAMKQDWSTPHAAGDMQGMMPQQADAQNCMFMPGMEAMTAQQNWSADGQSYWYVPTMDQSQMHGVDQSQMLHMEQPPMMPMDQSQMMMPMEHSAMMPVDQSQMYALDQSQFMQQQPVVHLPPAAFGQQPQLPQFPPATPSSMSTVTPTSSTSGEATPADFDRCLGIVMPQAAQFPCDKEMLAAHLKATADCQFYED